MMPALPIVERLATLPLPRRDRETILADLREERGRTAQSDSRGRGWVVWQCLGIAARWHGEAYHEPDDRFRILGVLIASLCLLWLVPVASAPMAGGPPEYFTDPVTRAVVAVWAASHVTSAAAVGLLLGRIDVIRPHAEASRWHTVLLFAALALVRFGGSRGAVAIVALVIAAWLGDRTRRATEVREINGVGLD